MQTHENTPEPFYRVINHNIGVIHTTVTGPFEVVCYSEVGPTHALPLHHHARDICRDNIAVGNYTTTRHMIRQPNVVPTRKHQRCDVLHPTHHMQKLLSSSRIDVVVFYTQLTTCRNYYRRVILRRSMQTIIKPRKKILELFKIITKLDAIRCDGRSWP